MGVTHIKVKYLETKGENLRGKCFSYWIRAITLVKTQGHVLKPQFSKLGWSFKKNFFFPGESLTKSGNVLTVMNGRVTLEFSWQGQGHRKAVTLGSVTTKEFLCRSTVLRCRNSVLKQLKIQNPATWFCCCCFRSP